MSQPFAGIVTYWPDTRILEGLIAQIAPEVSAVIIIANSFLNDTIIATLKEAANGTEFIYHPHYENIGLGAAFSQIVSIARGKAAERIVLFDQDSSPHPGMIGRLGEILDTLQREGHHPAVVGPRPVPPADGKISYRTPTIHLHSPHKASGRTRAVWFVVSSGSLIPLDAIDDVGLFDAQLFVDATDVEWCMRAWSRSYTCWLADDVSMPHRLGIGATGLFGSHRTFTVQRSWRLSLYARNQAALLRRDYIPWSWKVRWVAYFLCQVFAYFVIDRGEPGRSKALLRGFYTGMRGHLGRPADLPVHRD